MTYIIADPDIQNGIELKKILDGYDMLNFQGSYTSLSTAEKNILEHPPDVAFIRLGTVELNAFNFAAVICERNPLSNVIFIGSQKENAVEAFEYGADGFLLMPFNKTAISRLMQQSTK